MLKNGHGMNTTGIHFPFSKLSVVLNCIGSMLMSYPGALNQSLSPFSTNYQNSIALMSGASHVSLHILSKFWHETFLSIRCVSSMGQKHSLAFHQIAYYIDFINIFLIISISLSCLISVGTAIAATKGIILGSR